MVQKKVDRGIYPEKIDPSAFIAETATVMGDVTVGRESSIWYGAVVRGDTAPITIGERTNIQDGCIVHVAAGQPTTIGDGVTMGHGAIVHGATIGHNVIVAVRAVVLDGAVVGENSIIGAGSVVTEGTVIPPNSLVLGVPGRVVRPVSQEQAERIRSSARNYVEYSRAYM